MVPRSRSPTYLSGGSVPRKQSRVPSSRLGRLARVAKLAGGVAGGMVAEGSRRLSRGERPRASDLLLTPANAQRLTDELANLRGAAMKLGQILSMDTGEVLPRELTDILARLRADGVEMPPEQLDQTMTEAYGEDWENLFYGFDHHPLAAASIGQVHRAYSPDGREIVLKIQYPGVMDSIDSDVNNIAALLRMSGLLPASIDIEPLLAAAREQLRDEADYLTEAQHLENFGAWLAEDPRFIVPEVFKDISRDTVLAMSYVPSQPVEDISNLPQDERDRIMTSLFDLMLREFFELRVVQTDPNFANYGYRPEPAQIVLMDFGASRKFTAKFVTGYRRIVKAALRGDRDGMMAAAISLGYLVEEDDPGYRDFVSTAFELAMEPMMHDGAYDFAQSDLPARMSALGESAWEYRDAWQAPPADSMFFHRKLGGMFMMAGRFKARVDLGKLVLDRV